MKKLIFLLLITTASYGQTYQNPTFGTVTTKTSPTVTNDPYVTTTGTTGIQGKIAPVNLIIPHTPVNYTVPNLTIGAHLSGIDTRLGQISSTTAGLTQRIYFTADNTTVNSVIYFASNATSKGSTAAGSPPNLVLADNTKGYFTKDLISIPQPAPTIGYAGSYSGNLTVSATPTPVATQQRFTVEVYRTDNLGTPIASGVSGAPVGDLGVTVVAILDSGIINLTAGSITNVSITGILTQNITINTGERLRYHVSAAKIGTGGGNVTFGVYYGSSYNSYYDVPVAIRTNAVLNDSGVTGVTATDALDNLNIANQQIAGAGVTYGHITDAAQTIAGVKTYVNTGATQINGLSLINNGTLGSYVLNISNTSTGYGLVSNNSNTGSGLRSTNSSTGYGIHSSNSGSGFGIYTSNSGSGVGITSNAITSATGFNFSGRLNDVDNFTVDKNGNIFSTTIGIGTSSITNPIHVKKTASSILLDGIRVDRDPTVLSSAIFNAFGGAASIVSNSGVTSAFSPIAFFLSDGTTTNEVGRFMGTGVFKISNLSGVGSRTVVADASGNLSATTDLATKANLASPTFTGDPKAPTPTAGDNDTSIATTAFVFNNARPYKVYTALISQTGTSAPTATVLENTLGGTVTWARTGTGVYTATLSGAFTANKTACIATKEGFTTSTIGAVIYLGRSGPNEVMLRTNSNAAGASDGLLTGDTIEIRVYN